MKTFICFVCFVFWLNPYHHSLQAQIFLPVDLTFEKLPVHSIVVDEENKKWVGTEKGVFTIEDVTENADVNQQTILAQVPVSCIELNTTTTEKQIWFVSYNNRVVVQYQNTQQQHQFNFLGKNLVSGLAFRQETVFVVSRGGGLWKYEPNKRAIAIPISENYLNDIVLFNNRLWLASETGLLYEKKPEKFKFVTDLVKVTLLRVHQNRLYVVGFTKKDKVVLRSTSDGKNWQSHILPDAFMYQPPRALAFDSQNKIWIAADRVACWDNGTWKEFSEHQGFQSTSALSLAIDKNDNVWVGTEGRGLFVCVVNPSDLPLSNLSSQTEHTNIENTIISLDELASDTNPSGKRLQLAIQFKTATADILPDYKGELEKLAHILQTNKDLTIIIAGHTAPLGNAQKNQDLSEQRAKEVKKYLVQKGIESQRITTIGFGGTQPISTDLNQMQKNRRVEVIFK